MSYFEGYDQKDMADDDNMSNPDKNYEENYIKSIEDELYALVNSNNFEQFVIELIEYTPDITQKFFHEFVDYLVSKNKFKFLLEFVLGLRDHAPFVPLIFFAELPIPKELRLKYLKDIYDTLGEELTDQEIEYFLDHNLEELVQYNFRDVKWVGAIFEAKHGNLLPLKYLVFNISSYVINLRELSVVDPRRSIFDQPKPNYMNAVHNQFNTFDPEGMSEAGFKRSYNSSIFMWETQINPKYLDIIINETLNLGRVLNTQEINSVVMFILDDLLSKR